MLENRNLLENKLYIFYVVFYCTISMKNNEKYNENTKKVSTNLYFVYILFIDYINKYTYHTAP